MATPSNVRTKTPRPLAGDDRTADHGLARAFRWGSLHNTPAPHLPDAASDDGVAPPSARGAATKPGSRWSHTPSTIQPSSLRSRESSRSPDYSPTPPPTAVTLTEPRSGRRRTGLREPHVDAYDLADAAPTLNRPRWHYWAAASLLAVALSGTAALLGKSREVVIAHGSVVAQIETRGISPEVPMAPNAAALAVASAQSTEPTPPPAVPSKTGSFSVSYEGHLPIDGGVLHIPNTFRPREGGYDLVIHFHGDVRIVRESVERANVNAVLAIINWGVRSVPYRDIYKETGRFERLVAQIHSGVAQRGFKNLELRRMALTAWSAGYGAIESILETRLAPNAESDPLDAIILLDGIHAAFVDDDRNRVSEISVLPFLRAAKAAANDRIMFTLTHSEIDPVLYASTKRSAELLLTSVGAHPSISTNSPPQHLKLKAAQRSIGRDTALQPTADTRVGNLHIVGYRGITPEAHAAHLLQMGSIALPELAARWTHAAPPAVHPVLGDDASEPKATRKLPPGSTVLPPTSRLLSNQRSVAATTPASAATPAH